MGVITSLLKLKKNREDENLSVGLILRTTHQAQCTLEKQLFL